MVLMILFRLWIQRVINHQVFLLLLLTAPRIHSYWICSCFWSLAMKRLSVSFVLICPGVCDPLMPCLCWHGVGSFLDGICLLMLMILISIPYLWLDLDGHIICKLVISNWRHLYKLYTIRQKYLPCPLSLLILVYKPLKLSVLALTLDNTMYSQLLNM